MKTLNLVAITALAALSLSAQAKTDVNQKIEQLRENTENGKANLKQYEDNLKTVEWNLKESDKATKLFTQQRQSLAKQNAEAQKGKSGVDAQRKQLDGFIQAEKQKLDVDKKQIDELKAALAQAEANAKKRTENINKYEEKRKKAEQELASWSGRGDALSELDRTLAEKQTQAKADNKRLTEKKAQYEGEISKWKKQVRVSERSYENFSQLKE